MKQNRNAFTMIELIFVIIIIGILAIVGVPRLMGSKTDATESICRQESTQLVEGMSSFYGAKGTLDAQIQEISNLGNGLSDKGTKAGDGSHGISEPSNTNPTTSPITYVCNGENTIVIQYQTNQTIGKGSNYTVLNVSDAKPTNEASQAANKKLNTQGFFKQYILDDN